MAPDAVQVNGLAPCGVVIEIRIHILRKCNAHNEFESAENNAEHDQVDRNNAQPFHIHKPRQFYVLPFSEGRAMNRSVCPSATFCCRATVPDTLPRIRSAASRCGGAWLPSLPSPCRYKFRAPVAHCGCILVSQGKCPVFPDVWLPIASK